MKISKKNVKELFKLVEQKINLEAKEAGFSEHNLTSGVVRESSLRKFLISLLPEFFKYGDGVLIDPNGDKSPQQDIIIYSPYMSILTQDSKLFPIDSVYSTIEVKTTLNKTELKKSMKSISKVKRLKKSLNGNIQCNIFAYSSDSSGTLFKNINEIKRKLSLGNEDLFDNLCVNGSFLITNNPLLKSLSKTQNDYNYILMNLNERSLPYFLDSIVNAASSNLHPIPIFMKYLGYFKMEIQEWKLE